MTNNRPLKVFLCHSSNDKPAVRELRQKLRMLTPNRNNNFFSIKEKNQNYVNEHINLGKLALICFQE